MAAKIENKTIERTYTVPLRREYLKAPKWNRTKKAVSALRQFLAKHMKSEDVRLGTALNEKLWKHGIKNPPHHVKVSVTKNEEGVVNAELFGVKKEEVKKESKKDHKIVNKEHKKSIEEKKEEAKVEESKQEQETLEHDKPEPEEEKLPKVKSDLKTTQSVPNKKNELY
jgi:large subunit ribosomal protein L31e